MGFLGAITGWDQTKEAHNAVLASHLAETASSELKQAIVDRIVIFQQQFAPRSSRQQVLADLNRQPRMVQANFIALACTSLGIPGPHGLSFGSIDNPYRSDRESSHARISVAVTDLSRRVGRQMHWPGNNVRIDFFTWGAAGTVAVSPPPRKPADMQDAVNLAHHMLLAEAFGKEAVARVATAIASDDFGDVSEYELALATAGFLLHLDEIVPHAFPLQLGARLCAAQWLTEGKISPGVAAHFENTMHELYRGHG